MSPEKRLEIHYATWEANPITLSPVAESNDHVASLENRYLRRNEQSNLVPHAPTTREIMKTSAGREIVIVNLPVNPPENPPPPAIISR